MFKKNIYEINKQNHKKLLEEINNLKTKFRALSFFSNDSVLIEKINDSKTNYLIFNVNSLNYKEINSIIKQFDTKIFIELEIPIEIFDKIDFSELRGFKKVTISFNNDKFLHKINEVFAEIISKKYYPFVKGIPFCLTKIEHCREFFDPKKIIKIKECQGCIFEDYCGYEGKGFKINKITNKKKFVEEIKFLKNEGINARF